MIEFSIPNYDLLITQQRENLLRQTRAHCISHDLVGEGSVLHELILNLAEEYTTNVNCLVTASELLKMIKDLDEQDGGGYFETDATYYSIDNGLRNQLTKWNEAWPKVTVHVYTTED